MGKAQILATCQLPLSPRDGGMVRGGSGGVEGCCVCLVLPALPRSLATWSWLSYMGLCWPALLSSFQVRCRKWHPWCISCVKCGEVGGCACRLRTWTFTVWVWVSCPNWILLSVGEWWNCKVVSSDITWVNVMLFLLPSVVWQSMEMAFLIICMYQCIVMLPVATSNLDSRPISTYLVCASY